MRSRVMIAAALMCLASAASADPLTCNVSAEVEWTFPLDFVEVVWGDGQTTDRQIIPATHLPAFGKHRFSIPFNAAGKKWVRFAVWDVAGNGALVQPIKLTAPPTTEAR